MYNLLIVLDKEIHNPGLLTRILWRFELFQTRGGEARTFLFNRYLTICVEKREENVNQAENIHSI